MLLSYKEKEKSRNRLYHQQPHHPPHHSFIQHLTLLDNKYLKNHQKRTRRNSQMEKVFPLTTQKNLRNLEILKTIIMKFFVMIQLIRFRVELVLIHHTHKKLAVHLL